MSITENKNEENGTQTLEEQKSTKPKRRVLNRRNFLIGGAATVAVAGGGTAWAYNRYIADHTEISDVSSYEAQSVSNSDTKTQAASESELTGITVNDSGLTADNGSITLSTVVQNEGTSDQITAYVADIKLNSATLLRSAFANNEFGLNIIDYPSNIASDNNGIWAINGDYYGFRETGIEIRNGVVYRDSGAREGLAFYTDGTVKVYDETTTNAQALVDAGVWNTVSFGPSLIDNGSIASGIEDYEVDTNVGNHSIQGNQPRTGIGYVEPNHYIIIAVDGRSEGYSRGVTMTEFAQMFIDQGCSIGYNIDGGGSTDMIFNGKVYNNPLGKGQERGTSDILYIAGTAA